MEDKYIHLLFMTQKSLKNITLTNKRNQRTAHTKAFDARLQGRLLYVHRYIDLLNLFKLNKRINRIL